MEPQKIRLVMLHSFHKPEFSSFPIKRADAIANPIREIEGLVVYQGTPNVFGVKLNNKPFALCRVKDSGKMYVGRVLDKGYFIPNFFQRDNFPGKVLSDEQRSPDDLCTSGYLILANVPVLDAINWVRKSRGVPEQQHLEPDWISRWIDQDF